MGWEEGNGGGGGWGGVSFADEAAKTRWGAPVESAFRLLSDSGFGGERSRGWGRCEAPEFVEGVLPDLIFSPAPAAEEAPKEEVFWSEPAASPSQAYWMLSLFAPMAGDTIDWDRAAYSLVPPPGRLASPAP